ncbi:hypothetical protein C0Q70_08157 [Pomacea canaliculata]|uniref:Uncharacterized protein n=1 Tax=Pomacea canaliculata TaxID=400727 RepID=A0A2T7PH15_POMCA|nr:hypothetical protein C0Q70_08157 [Pomacea canaliculata]
MQLCEFIRSSRTTDYYFISKTCCEGPGQDQGNITSTAEWGRGGVGVGPGWGGPNRPWTVDHRPSTDLRHDSQLPQLWERSDAASVPLAFRKSVVASSPPPRWGILQNRRACMKRLPARENKCSHGVETHNRPLWWSVQQHMQLRRRNMADRPEKKEKKRKKMTKEKQ